MESDEEEEDTAANTIPSEELNLVVRELTVRLENLKTCYDLITKHGAALQRALSELESGEDLANKTKIVSERATLFRISSNAMINVRITKSVTITKGIKLKCIVYPFLVLLNRLAPITYRQRKLRATNGPRCCNTNVTRNYTWRKWSSNWQGSTHI